MRDNAPPGAQVRLADAERPPFSDGSFMAVAMSGVFMFLPEPAAVLRECGRVMGAGGRLALNTTAPELLSRSARCRRVRGSA